MNELIEKYLYAAQLDYNHRYKSWEHCYNAFANFDNSNDYLALHLAFYLASWGMYRGSSGLLWKDYKVHMEAIEILKSHRNQRKNNSDNLPNISELLSVVNELRNYYSSKSFFNGKNEKNQITATDTLISKIILGTLGSLPAFDRYFNIGFFSKEYSKIDSINLEKIWQFTIENKLQIENLQKWIYEEFKILYPPMKIIDMYFWQLGFDN